MATTTETRRSRSDSSGRAGRERTSGSTSKSLARAKGISSPDEKPDRPGQTLQTRSHEVIKAWAEARGARPAAATRGPDGQPRTLRLDFGEATRNLEPIDWDEWFRVFDERGLVFVYQERRRDGRQSNFFRLANPGREDG
jgi:hypothetical protein